MKRELSNEVTAALCRDLRLLMRSSVPLGDGFEALAEETKDPGLRALLGSMGKRTDEGAALSEVIRETGRFSSYVSGLIEVGERTGRLEETLQALSSHYTERERVNRQIRMALTYPAILLVLMLVVIVVLLSQVLPVFEDVYASLGRQMGGIAQGLLVLGEVLVLIMPVLIGLLGVVVVCLALFYWCRPFRDRLLLAWRRVLGDFGIARKTNDARFAQAMAMGLQSGMTFEEAIHLAAELLKDTPRAYQRYCTAVEEAAEGTEVNVVTLLSGILPPAELRMFRVGMISGTTDTAMEDISRRLAETAQLAMERRVAQVEPALVFMTSFLVGLILLTVMIPLMNIMTAVG